MSILIQTAREGADYLRDHLGLTVLLALSGGGLWFALRVLTSVREALGA